MLNLNITVRRKPGLVAATMDGELVMLDMDSGHCFGLSGVGPYIWNMLEQECTVAAIVAGVKAEFAIGAGDSVDEDVTNFLQTLIDKGLVTVAS